MQSLNTIKNRVQKTLLKPATLALAGLATITGCTDYSFSLNQKVLYTPPSLFSDFSVEDEHLQNCLQQTIIDQQVVAAKQLLTLNCSNANITSVAGIELFAQLQKVNFDHNGIDDIKPLASLRDLQLLLLNSNELTDITPLATLENIDRLELSDNPALSCQQPYWAHIPKTLVLPKQCKP